MNNNDILEVFGKLLIEKVRDYTIFQMKELILGEAKAPALKALYDNIKHLSDRDKKNLDKIMITVIDNSISNFLWMLEQEMNLFDLTFLNKPLSVRQSLHDVSDGLCGDYWDFIDNYSEYSRGTS